MRSTSLLWVCLALSVIGCDSSDGPPPFRPIDAGSGGGSDAAACDPGDERVAAVYNGTAEPTHLPLTPGEILAIARIDTGGGLCSGTVIAPRWVLTAKHCVSRGRASISVGSNPNRLDHQIAVSRQLGHATMDIALFELAEDATVAVPGLTPIRIADFSLTGLVGQTGEASGYGEQEDRRTTGQRRFSAEPIVSVRGDYTTIDGRGQRGVCFGDSGGPLMVLAEDSSVRVIGALSYGDPNCLGRDNYTRVDLARSWIESNTGMTPTTTGCNGVTEAGTCRGSTAVWCENDELESDVCSGDERCMPGPGGRVACVPASQDPCGGLDFVGRCEGSVATWCEGSTVRRADCGSCGMTCTVDPVRGGAVCD